jgi:aminoglycoside/choline kinase family phosphotransferase
LLHREQQLQAWINQSTTYECDALEIVSGDASFRRYFRFSYQGQSIIAVDAPPEHENASQFIAVANSYQACSINVPRIFAYDLVLGFYIQQDFGNYLFSQALNNNNAQRLYSDALAIIPKIQKCLATENAPLPTFDQSFIDRELGLFTEWLLGEYLDLTLGQDEQLMLKEAFASIAASCLSQPMAGVHRDFHSRNLMLVNEGKIGVIDFQDAVIGPITYDAVSLLRDSYQDWPAQTIDKWLFDWHAKYYSQYQWAEFKTWFDCVGMQRHLKIAGIFARLAIRDKKHSFLQDIPHTLNYLILEASQYSHFAGLTEFLQKRILPAVLNKLSRNHDH